MQIKFACLVAFALSVISVPAIAQSWTYEIKPGADRETQCVSPSGEKVGGWRLCDTDGTCNNAAAIKERCQMRHGTQTGEWSYIVNPRFDWETKCINPSGNFVGDWRSCREDGTCNNAAAIKDKCRTNPASSSQGSPNRGGHGASPDTAQSQSAATRITIYLDGSFIISTDTRQIAVRDTVCNEEKGTFALQGNQRIPIPICQSSSGYGRVEYRNVTNNGYWIGSSFLKNGDSVSP